MGEDFPLYRRVVGRIVSLMRSLAQYWSETARVGTEIDLSLCVFREIWAGAGSENEIEVGDEDSGKLFLMKNLTREGQKGLRG